MKEIVMEWYVRNNFKYWKIQNSKGKVIANVSPNTEKPADPNGELLRTELESLERQGITERYEVGAIAKNGQDYNFRPFHVVSYAQNNGMSSGGALPLDFAVQFGKLQSDMMFQQIMYQKDREIEALRGEKSGGIGEVIKASLPALMPVIAPALVNVLGNIAAQSPAAVKFLENPAVQNAISSLIIASATQNGQSTGTQQPTE